MTQLGKRREFSLFQLLEKVSSVSKTSLQILGDANIVVCGANPVRDAKAGEVTLIDSDKNHSLLSGSQAAVVVTNSPIEACRMTQLVSNNAHLLFEQIVACFRNPISQPAPGIHRLAMVDPSAQVGADCWIAEGASVGRECLLGERCRIHRGVHVMDGCVLGDDCEIFPGAVLYPHTVVGNRVLIHAAAVIGAYGFGYRQQQGKHIRTAQLGYVLIQDDVEIGAGTTIDRGTYGPTTIGEGTKIDNQVMIGHNCSIGKHNLLCAQVGIAGSSSTGDYVVMGGQVGLRDHIHIGNKTMIAAQSGVASDIPEDQTWMGSPAMPQREYFQIFFHQNRLPDMKKQLKQLQKSIEQLESMLGLQADDKPSHSEDRKVA